MAVLVDRKLCVSCGGCVAVCPVAALELNDRYPVCSNACTNCGICVKFCPVGALRLV